MQKNGAKLALLGRDRNKLNELQAELSFDENIIYLEYESRDKSAVASAINKTNEKFGFLDAVIAYAATEGAVKPLTSTLMNNSTPYLKSTSQEFGCL